MLLGLRVTPDLQDWYVQPRRIWEQQQLREHEVAFSTKSSLPPKEALAHEAVICAQQSSSSHDDHATSDECVDPSSPDTPQHEEKAAPADEAGSVSTDGPCHDDPAPSDSCVVPRALLTPCCTDAAAVAAAKAPVLCGSACHDHAAPPGVPVTTSPDGPCTGQQATPHSGNHIKIHCNQYNNR